MNSWYRKLRIRNTRAEGSIRLISFSVLRHFLAGKSSIWTVPIHAFPPTCTLQTPSVQLLLFPDGRLFIIAGQLFNQSLSMKPKEESKHDNIGFSLRVLPATCMKVLKVACTDRSRSTLLGIERSSPMMLCTWEGSRFQLGNASGGLHRVCRRVHRHSPYALVSGGANNRVPQRVTYDFSFSSWNGSSKETVHGDGGYTTQGKV